MSLYSYKLYFILCEKSHFFLNLQCFVTRCMFNDQPNYRRSGWSGGAMVLGKLPVPGRPTYLDDSRARAFCACSGCGWGLFGHF